MTLRRFAVLVSNLPPESATFRALRGEAGDFGIAEYQRADIIDALHGANWQRANAGVAKSKQAPVPDPSWRPGQAPPSRRTLLEPEEIRSRLIVQTRRDARRRARLERAEQHAAPPAGE